MDMKEKSTVLITCSSGLAPYLQAELEALGFQIGPVHDTGVETRATLNETMLLNLKLRTAYNVLYLLKEFRCMDPNQLYKNVGLVEWEKIIDSDEYLTVISRVNTMSIKNSMFPSVKTKDAVVDRILEKTGSRPDSGPERDNIVLGLYWYQENCRLYLNTSGRKLSDRTYRKIPHKAPLRESLAAALILESGYDGTMPLVLPMCGSGTLAIEAALIATGRSPGLLRANFCFMHTKGFDKTAWQNLRRQTLNADKKNAKKKNIKPIIATDIDPEAIDAAKKNALTAGVEHLIEFDVCDFTETTIPEEPGIIMLNPEYGMRLGDTEELTQTYEKIGDFFKQSCPGYTGYIFTGNPDLAKKVGLRTSRKIPFFNGDIDCRLLKYELYEGSRKKT
ncbi:MAG: class I SAM-dependent RNA methyltransferase [Planctomycetes bacterium]|nr:class I SAM-dependent RNA methyltransferase [Planctomycetota bacterium]